MRSSTLTVCLAFVQIWACGLVGCGRVGYRQDHEPSGSGGEPSNGGLGVGGESDDTTDASGGDPSLDGAPGADCLDQELAPSIAHALDSSADESGEADPLSIRHIHLIEGDLAGIECLTQLESLGFYFHDEEPFSSEDIARLAQLKKLTALHVTKAPDLSFLSALPQLTALSISAGTARDLDSVRSLKKLRSLSLTGVHYLSNLEAIETLDALTELSLFDVSVGDMMTWDSSFLSDLVLERLFVFLAYTDLDLAALDTSKLGQVHLESTPVNGLAELGPPVRDGSELALGSAYFEEHDFDPEALCEQGWCIKEVLEPPLGDGPTRVVCGDCE